MSDETYTIKEMLVEIRSDYTTRLDSQDKLLSEIKQDGKETKDKVGIQNGRVRLLEDWSIKAQKIIEDNTETLSMYKIDKAKLWTAVAVVVFMGGAIITLSIMAIDTKIEKGILSALEEFEEIEIVQ